MKQLEQMENMLGKDKSTVLMFLNSSGFKISEQVEDLLTPEEVNLITSRKDKQGTKEVKIRTNFQGEYKLRAEEATADPEAPYIPEPHVRRNKCRQQIQQQSGTVDGSGDANIPGFFSPRESSAERLTRSLTTHIGDLQKQFEKK